MSLLSSKYFDSEIRTVQVKKVNGKIHTPSKVFMLLVFLRILLVHIIVMLL